MPPSSDPPQGEFVRVRRPMNAHGTMTVEVVAGNELRHLVEYASPALRESLGSLPAGTVVPLCTRRLGCRANVWRATGFPSHTGVAGDRARNSSSDPDAAPGSVAGADDGTGPPPGVRSPGLDGESPASLKE